MAGGNWHNATTIGKRAVPLAILFHAPHAIRTAMKTQGWHTYFSTSIAAYGDNVHFYLNMRTFIQCEWAISYFKKVLHSKQVVCTVQEENKGMDIGGFLISYRVLYVMPFSYDVIAKLHEKTNAAWRKRLIDPIFRNQKSIKNAVETLAHPKSEFGMLYGSRTAPSTQKCYGDDTDIHKDSSLYIRYTDNPAHYFRNMESVEFLVNFFDLEKNRSHWSFVAGTLFLVRASILDVLTPEKLAAAYSMLTSDQTYDLRWLKYMARMKGATPQEVLRRAVVQNLPKSFLSNFKAGGYFADFSLEFGWERIFALFVYQHGLTRSTVHSGGQDFCPPSTRTVTPTLCA